MTSTKLDIAFWNYDRTRALSDGSVKIDGVDATFHSARIVTEIFEGMIAEHAFDVSELGLTYFLRTMEAENPPFIALPIFPNRAFRHSAIYINKASGIDRPEDLKGKRIGELALYGHDAGIMAKGVLSDDYGVRVEQSRWLVGGLDWPIKPITFVSQPHPPDVDVTYAAQGDDLGKMLEDGALDALISADVPKCVLEKSPKVGLLFADSENDEREYYRQTGIFPIMHTVVVRREFAEKNPDIVRSIYKAFCEARDAAIKTYEFGMIFNSMGTMLPWLNNLIDEDRELLGTDWWPYGIEANRKALDAYLRYHYEQGLSKRRMTFEDIFVSYLLNT